MQVNFSFFYQVEDISSNDKGINERKVVFMYFAREKFSFVYGL